MKTRNRSYVHRIYMLLYLLVLAAFLVTPRPVIAQQQLSPGALAIEYGTNMAGSQSVRYYVTPDNPMVKTLAESTGNVEAIYDMALNWVYVSEETLNGVSEKWLTPYQFLHDTPGYPSNPVAGQPVSDCEEQANTLASLLRAGGVPAEDVRVVLGRYTYKGQTHGHAWVQLVVNGKWLDLDPSSGPFWDDTIRMLIPRSGVPFDYYASHKFPVTRIDLYYNDKYVFKPGGSTADVPPSWLN